jgi:hypothetical protein
MNWFCVLPLRVPRIQTREVPSRIMSTNANMPSTRSSAVDGSDRKFMQIAFDEMMKSRCEHKEKSDPMVGAVLVGKDGGHLGSTLSRRFESR